MLTTHQFSLLVCEHSNKIVKILLNSSMEQGQHVSHVYKKLTPSSYWPFFVAMIRDLYLISAQVSCHME